MIALVRVVRVVRVGGYRELGGHHDLVAVRLDERGDELLVLPHAVHVGRVEERHAQLQGPLQRGPRLVGVRRTVGEAHAHTAEALHPDPRSAGAQLDRLDLVAAHGDLRTSRTPDGRRHRCRSCSRVRPACSGSSAIRCRTSSRCAVSSCSRSAKVHSPGPHQLGVADHVRDRHAGQAQLGHQAQPVQIAVGEAPLAGVGAVHVRHQADPLVPAQGVRAEPGVVRHLADRVLVPAGGPRVRERGAAVARLRRQPPGRGPARDPFALRYRHAPSPLFRRISPGSFAGSSRRPQR